MWVTAMQQRPHARTSMKAISEVPPFTGPASRVTLPPAQQLTALIMKACTQRVVCGLRSMSARLRLLLATEAEAC